MRERKLLLIEWADANSPMSGGWQDIDGIDNKTITVVSVGYALKESKKAITLAAHIGGKTEEHCVNGLMTIPQVCVTRRVELKEAKGAA